MAQTVSTCGCLPAALAKANAVMGNKDEAQRWAEEVIEQEGLHNIWAIWIMTHLDIERAVEIAFGSLATSGGGSVFDEIAANHVWYRPFLVHSRVQEYYLNEGKWIDYLSARVPEYAKYAPAVAE